MPMKESNDADRQFKEWCALVFQAPAAKATPRMPCLDKSTRIRFISRLFTGFERYSSKYTDDVVVEGLRNLIDPGLSDEMFLLFDREIEVAKRKDAIQSLSGVFDYFSRKCLTNLHAKRDSALNSPNYLCLMWWDVFPANPASNDPGRKEVDAAFLLLFANTLKSPSPVVQEISLHGLGHWQHAYPEDISKIISDYLGHNPCISLELKKYAEAASEGMVH